MAFFAAELDFFFQVNNACLLSVGSGGLLVILTVPLTFASVRINIGNNEATPYLRASVCIVLKHVDEHTAHFNLFCDTYYY